METVRRHCLLLVTLLLVARSGLADERYWPPIVDPPTGVQTPGKWLWADLVTSDVALAAGFYGAVFGWQFETYGGADDRDTYTLVLADGRPIGGMVFDSRPFDRRPEAPTANASRWVALASVPDVGAAVAAATAAGGRVVVPARVLGARGETAALIDPEGALFGVVKSAAGDPADFLADPGEWLWIELWADDPEASARFYRAVLGYTTTEPTADSATIGYVLGRDGRARAGVLRKPAAGLRTTWLPYVRVASVADTIARAQAAGARTVGGPFSRPAGTVAVLVDPVGAPFAIAELAADERNDDYEDDYEDEDVPEDEP